MLIDRPFLVLHGSDFNPGRSRCVLVPWEYFSEGRSRCVLVDRPFFAPLGGIGWEMKVLFDWPFLLVQFDTVYLPR